MKSILKSILLFTLIFSTYALNAQSRKITGIVYREGKPAAGITVAANKPASNFYTGFDGKYELTINEKTKYLTFTFIDESKKLVIEGNTSDQIDFSWDGVEIPKPQEKGITLLSHEELIKAKNMSYLTDLSLYSQYLKQGDIKSAIINWRTLYQTFPKSRIGLYVDGIQIYDTLMNSVTDVSKKMQYLDTIMMIYDRRAKYMGDEGIVAGLKTDKYLKTALNLDLSPEMKIAAFEKGYGFAEKSISILDSKTQPAVLIMYFSTTIGLYDANKFPLEKIIENYDKISAIIEKELKDTIYSAVAIEAKIVVDKLFENSAAANCEALSKMYGEKIKANPNNIEILRKTVNMLRRKECTDGLLYVEASEKLYALDANAESAYNMARMFYRKKDFDKADSYYTQAFGYDNIDSISKATYLYESATIANSRGNIKIARERAKRALSLNPTYCEAYMLLGYIYAEAAKNFSDDDFLNKTLYWLSVDYFNKAARFETCKSDASDKAIIYSRYFPDKEAIFMNGFSEGKSHSIEGWINETTTIRALKK